MSSFALDGGLTSEKGNLRNKKWVGFATCNPGFIQDGRACKLCFLWATCTGYIHSWLPRITRELYPNLLQSFSLDDDCRFFKIRTHVFIVHIVNITTVNVSFMFLRKIMTYSMIFHTNICS